MGCLLALMASVFPRIAVLLIWVARPVYFTAAFGGAVLLPLLGILFLPFTTLLYVVMWKDGINGFDIFLLGLAVILDVSHWGASTYANRDKLPAYNSRMTD